MHIVERISSYLRCPPQKPDSINMNFHPLPDKYITIYNDSSMPSCQYDYFQDVISEIKETLESHGYKICSLVTEDAPKMLWTTPIVNPTIPQINYIVQNSSLHICSDPYTNEVAGLLNTPVICLVGNRWADNFYSYWANLSDKNEFCTKNKIIQGKKTKKPSFLPEEQEKNINDIKPETIIQNVYDFLGIDCRPISETRFIGSKYPKIEIDYIPSTPLVDEVIAKFPINVRLDKHFNIDALSLSKFSSPVTIISNKPIPKDNLIHLKPIISNIKFYVDEKSPIDIAKHAVSLGISCELFTKVDEDGINDVRFKFIDYVVRSEKTKNLTGSFDEIFSSEDNLFCRTSKVIVYNDEKYASYEHLKRGIILKEENSIFNTDLFLETSEFMKIYKKDQ